VDELFKLIQLFVVKFPDSTEQEIHEINNFKKQILQLYLQVRYHKTFMFKYLLCSMGFWSVSKVLDFPA
jgi:hypothetical protein